MSASASVDSVHSQYAKAASQWKMCRDAYEGEEAVKSGGEQYLPRLSDQTPEEYGAYKRRAQFFNATGRTVQGLTGMAMGKGAELQLPDALKQHVSDVTLDAEPFDLLATHAVDQVLTTGRFGILLDWSGGQERPYWVPFAAEDIINWDTSVREGDTTLTFLVLREKHDERHGFAITSVTRYRVYELLADGTCHVTIWKPGPSDKGGFVADGTAVPTRKGTKLTFIPFVCFGPKGCGMSVHKPPLLDLVYVNFSHYRTSADLEHGRHFTALPTPVVTGTGQTPMKALRIGSSEAWCLPNAGADAKFLEFTGKGLETLEKALDSKEKQMQILGARLLEPQKAGQEAHQTVRLRHAGDFSVLQTIASGISLGLTTLWRWHAWWMSATDDPNDDTITASLSDNLTIEPDVDLDNLLLHVQAGKISYLTYYACLQRAGMARDGVSAEQEREAIIAEGGLDPLGGVGGGDDPNDDPDDTEDPDKQPPVPSDEDDE